MPGMHPLLAFSEAQQAPAKIREARRNKATGASHNETGADLFTQ
jgi:hypothetical protein